ncbi:MAG: putative ABC transport system ATP-binding protein [Candidatus Paceibacteria bacterium]|jgi:putative ABC transport system ATP-binding protein
MSLIEIKKLYKKYVNDTVVTEVLFDVDLKIEKGEFIAIMGPSGSGKSTLMHILGFLDRASEGEYTFENNPTDSLSDDGLAEIRNGKIGFVFQAFNLLPRTTLLDNVALPLLYSNRPRSAHKELAEQALIAVGLEDRMDFFTNQISGGQKQRVAIARALVNDPEVLFADEPTGNLDSKSGFVVMDILRKLNEKGRTIILVTHEQETAEYADRIITIRDGKITSDEKVKGKN